MEKELEARLDKIIDEQHLVGDKPKHLMNITIATLAAVRAHLQEYHPITIGDILALEETKEILADYQ